MTTSRWYSPQLSREIISRLYLRAKSEGIPMTVLANQLMEDALKHNRQFNRQRVTGNQNITKQT